MSALFFCHFLEPQAGFKIAFNMFDADGNEMVDKREFMVVCFPFVYTYLTNSMCVSKCQIKHFSPVARGNISQEK